MQRAKKKRSLATWTRTCAALPAEPDRRPARRGATSRRGSRMSRAWPPEGIAFTVAATDVQSNRLETILLLGLPADRSWGAVLDYFICRPVAARPRRRCGEELQATLGRGGRAVWRRSIAGYLPARRAKRWRHRDRRCLPVVGRAGVRQPIAAPGGSGWCYVIGVDGLKRDRARARSIAAGSDCPRRPWCTRTWLHGLTAEHEEVVERGGRRVTVWKQHYRRNEALDCR